MLARSMRLGLASLLIGCALLGSGGLGCFSANQAYHKYLMRGSIVGRKGDRFVICIGSRDGAQIGQVLQTYDVALIAGDGTIPGGAGIPERPVRYERRPIGKVRITQILAPHFAEAEVVEGKVTDHAIVELAH